MDIPPISEKLYTLDEYIEFEENCPPLSMRLHFFVENDKK